MKKLILILLIVISSIAASAQETPIISLITCGPGQESYTLYGHTAIRLQQPAVHQDIIVNYGLFSFDQPNFALRFIFGKPNYIVGAIPTSLFLDEYRTKGRWVKEQVLNIDSLKAQQLIQTLALECMPANREYRYNIFYSNCTTKAADIIEQVCNIDFQKAYTPTNTTIRQFLHQYTNKAPWTQFGSDLLLGIEADRPPLDQRFLPMQLYQLAEKYTVEEHELLSASQQSSPSCPITPSSVFILISLLIVGCSLYEFFRKKFHAAIDLTSFILLGFVSICLFLMLFSSHPTVRLNLQILLFNPLLIPFAWTTIKHIRQQRFSGFLLFYSCCLIVFLIGAFWQCYAEGVFLLAIALLIRYALLWIHSKRALH